MVREYRLSRIVPQPARFACPCGGTDPARIQAGWGRASAESFPVTHPCGSARDHGSRPGGVAPFQVQRQQPPQDRLLRRLARVVGPAAGGPDGAVEGGVQVGQPGGANAYSAGTRSGICGTVTTSGGAHPARMNEEWSGSSTASSKATRPRGRIFAPRRSSACPYATRRENGIGQMGYPSWIPWTRRCGTHGSTDSAVTSCRSRYRPTARLRFGKRAGIGDITLSTRRRIACCRSSLARRFRWESE